MYISRKTLVIWRIYTVNSFILCSTLTMTTYIVSYSHPVVEKVGIFIEVKSTRIMEITRMMLMLVLGENSNFLPHTAGVQGHARFLLLLSNILT